MTGDFATIYKLLADDDNTSPTPGGVIFGFILLLIGVILYFLPTIIALARHARIAGAVVVVNLFLGWTFIGWVVALAMACGSAEEPRYNPLTVKCPRCNAEQNIAVGQPTFECWQCKYVAYFEH